MRWLKSLIWSLFIIVAVLALTLFSLYEFAPGTLFKWQGMAQSMQQQLGQGPGPGARTSP